MTRVVCAWCGRGVPPSDPAGSAPVHEAAGTESAVSHGLCLDCAPVAFGLPVEDLTRLTREQLEMLPYGAIRLDSSGRVLAYTAEEARLSRRRPEDVIGRDFFGEIAPCAHVREVAGWLEAARAAGKPATRRLGFVFRFPFGQELVRLSMSFHPEDGTSTILVRSAARESSPVVAR